MITVLNRRALCTTFSMEKQSKIRNVLSANHIDYIVKVINRNSLSVPNSKRGTMGTLGINISFAYEYIIYVHKKDLENAQRLLANLT